MVEERLRRPGTPSDPVIGFSSFDEFAKANIAPNGRFFINYEGLPIDFLYEDRGFDTIVVCFHGAVTTTVDLPFHVGYGIMNDVPANRLAVSDPTLVLGGGLKLAWYAGSLRQPGLQSVIAEIVASVSRAANAKNLIFFGTSGGGYAVLEMSSRFPGSLAVAVNPQTSISKYYEKPVKLYIETAWGARPVFQESHFGVRHDVVPIYSRGTANTVAYVQNTRDSFHVRNHEKPFMNSIGEPSEVWRLRDAWGDPAGIGHVPPAKPVIASILSAAADSAGQWSRGLISEGFRQNKG